jgi:hypothetical protein
MQQPPHVAGSVRVAAAFWPHGKNRVTAVEIRGDRRLQPRHTPRNQSTVALPAGTRRTRSLRGVQRVPIGRILHPMSRRSHGVERPIPLDDRGTGYGIFNDPCPVCGSRCEIQVIQSRPSAWLFKTRKRKTCTKCGAQKK